MCLHRFRCSCVSSAACLGKAQTHCTVESVSKGRDENIPYSSADFGFHEGEQEFGETESDIGANLGDANLTKVVPMPTEATTEHVETNYPRFDHNRLMIRTEGQPAMFVFLSPVEKMLLHRITAGRRPEHGSQSNGHAERAVTVGDEIGSLKLVLDARARVKTVAWKHSLARRMFGSYGVTAGQRAYDPQHTPKTSDPVEKS